MRRIIFTLAALALLWAMPSLSQLPMPSPLEAHGHARAVAAPVSRTPQKIFDATLLGSPLLLDKGWRVGITADPAAAQPDFDDSSWELRNAQDSFSDVPDQDHPVGGEGDWRQGHQRPSVWFRMHLRLAPQHGPISLLVELPVPQSTTMGIGSEEPGVDVFANGKLIHPEGPHGDLPQHFQSISRIYDLPVDPSQTSLTLVVRSIYIPTGFSAYTRFFATRKLLLGNRDDLDRALELWHTHRIMERLPRLVNSILLVILAAFLLALYFTQKGHVEYLWLALHELLQAPIGFVELAGSAARMNHLWFWALSLQLVAISAYLYFEFLVAFLALRRRWVLRMMRYTAPIMAGIAPTFLLVGQSTAVDVALVVVLLGSVVWMFCWLAFVFVTLIAATLRRNFEAGLLLIPLLLTLVGWIEPMLTASMSIWAGRAYRSPLTLQAGPIPIHFASIADFTGLFVIVLIIFVRFLRVQREQERVSNELAAARNVQELLIPQQKLQTPGFEVDSVYTPDAEVGGDFFYVHPTSDGGLLVVIGDVAGKGLKAAMNVSLLMGALRSCAELNPAKILESLNRVLSGGESFTTCQAVWLGADGDLVLANAGHLPPYLNSQEVNLPGSLPLGILPEVSYEEIRLYLHPGDRLLLLSDGVVESRQPSGELFGFDRVHNLSNQSAFYIADAAKSFGQQDDITVVTVRRL
jgi:hypothetical protein